jgi:LysM repeat protein
MSSELLLRARLRLPLAVLVLGMAGLAGCSTSQHQVNRPPPLPEPEPGLLPASINRAIDLLNAGNEAQARTELQRLLQVEPTHQLGNQLMRQLQADPLTVFGPESYAYTVKPGETLFRIAQRVLGDQYSFYLLARYNGIKVPGHLMGGQVIRLPGKLPAPAVQPAPPPPTQPSPPPPPPPPSPPPAPAPAPVAPAPVDAAQVNAAVRRGYERLKAQDLQGSLEQWNLVLSLDPGHAEAKRERARVLKLWNAWCKKREPGSRPSDCPARP